MRRERLILKNRLMRLGELASLESAEQASDLEIQGRVGVVVLSLISVG